MSQREILPSLEPTASQWVDLAFCSRCSETVAVDERRRARSVVGEGLDETTAMLSGVSPELVPLSESVGPAVVVAAGSEIFANAVA